MTPRERLKDAAHRLAGTAESLEEAVDPQPAPSLSNPYGIRSQGPDRTDVPSDAMPATVNRHLEEVETIVKEIRGIVK